MTKAEFKEIYGTTKRLNTIKRSDFTKYCSNWSLLFKGVHVRIEHDYYNGWWILSSDTEITDGINGRFYGSFQDVKNQIKWAINDFLKNK